LSRTLPLTACALPLGKPKDIVSPGVVEGSNPGKTGGSKVRAASRSEPLDDLPGTKIFFVGVGAHEV
jgi:hypothetical protein